MKARRFSRKKISGQQSVPSIRNKNYDRDGQLKRIGMRRLLEAIKKARHFSGFAVYLASTVIHLGARYSSCTLLFWVIWRSMISTDFGLSGKGVRKSDSFSFSVSVSCMAKSTWSRIVLIVKAAEICHSQR
jgi:hypothetical protein|tara:strand:+ start:482 stop:874 length:393 start_codon:yes stop_codon:yes gene_type:complete